MAANTECTPYGGTASSTVGADVDMGVEYEGFEVGERVFVASLKGRTDLNFRQGVVIEVKPEDLSLGRIPVRLNAEDASFGRVVEAEEVQVRAVNLHRVSGGLKGVEEEPDARDSDSDG